VWINRKRVHTRLWVHEVMHARMQFDAWRCKLTDAQHESSEDGESQRRRDGATTAVISVPEIHERASAPRFGSFDVSGLSKHGYAAARKLLLTDRSWVSSEYRTLSRYRCSRLHIKPWLCMNQLSVSIEMYRLNVSIWVVSVIFHTSFLQRWDQFLALNVTQQKRFNIGIFNTGIFAKKLKIPTERWIVSFMFINSTICHV